MTKQTKTSVKNRGSNVASEVHMTTCILPIIILTINCHYIWMIAMLIIKVQVSALSLQRQLTSSSVVFNIMIIIPCWHHNGTVISSMSVIT